MKTSKLFLVLAVALFAFASCSKSSDGVDEAVNSSSCFICICLVFKKQRRS